MNRLNQKVDVIIPVCQPDKRFFKLLAGLAMQTVVPEKVILLNVESGEPEDTCEALQEQIYHYFGKRKSFGKRLPLAIEIRKVEPEEFNQGETRHQGALASSSPFLLFMRQNAVPADEKLIEELLWSMEGDVGMAFARQTAELHMNVLETYRYVEKFSGKSYVTTQETLSEIGAKAYFCSNSCAMYRRDVYFEQGGFKRVIKNEDLLFAANLLRNGGRLAYCAQAKVKMKEKCTWTDLFKLCFDNGVFYSEHPVLFHQGGLSQMEFVLSKKIIAYLWNQKYYMELADFLCESVFKTAGFLLGKKHYLLPSEWKQAMSMNRIYWMK